MADQRRWLDDPVAAVLEPRRRRWPLWAMMGLGLYLTTVPFSYGWTQDEALFCQLLAGLSAFGLALFGRLYPPLEYVAFLNAFVGAGVLALQLLWGAPGPLWSGPTLIALALASPVFATMPAADAPAGWFHNPSAWIQRLPVVTLAVLGALAARECRPVAAVFLAAAAAQLLGDRRRWRTAPWALASAQLANAAALAGSAAWLGLSRSPAGLAGVVAGLLMLTLSADELAATRLFLRRISQLGQTPWSAFWGGGLLPEDPFAPRPNRRAAWAPPRALGRRHSRRRPLNRGVRPGEAQAPEN